MAKLRVLAHEVDDDDFRGFAAAMPHWNGQIPGDWSKLIRADAVGIDGTKFCNARSGVYRLIGLTGERDFTEPTPIGRICGYDKIGTLYIGSAQQGRPHRLGKLVRSLRKYSERSLRAVEHDAVGGLWGNQLLARKFPATRLAFTWSYEDHEQVAEWTLLQIYARSFGEFPPLNLQSKLPSWKPPPSAT